MPKTNKKKQTRRKTNNRKQKKRGGDCGCTKKWYGGYGAASYVGTPALGGQSAYSQNSFQNDPNNPKGEYGGSMENSRNLPDLKIGGKRRRKKMKGGFSDILLGSNQNPALTALNTPGAFIGKDVIFNNNLVSPYPWNQSTEKLFNVNNPPLA
jgi:hypothetical protein